MSVLCWKWIVNRKNKFNLKKVLTFVEQGDKISFAVAEKIQRWQQKGIKNGNALVKSVFRF